MNTDPHSTAHASENPSPAVTHARATTTTTTTGAQAPMAEAMVTIQDEDVAKETWVSIKPIANELAQEFRVESLSAPAVKEAQGQIQTVALQMDGIRNQVGKIKDQLPGLSQQTAALIEGAEALEQMYKQIDTLAIMIESVAATVQDVNGSIEQAERDLTSSALQPLQAVFETLKMGPKGFR